MCTRFRRVIDTVFLIWSATPWVISRIPAAPGGRGATAGVMDEPALRAAFATMQRRTRSVSFAVEAMVQRPGSVELIMGARQDASFGPVAMVGIGGIAAELLADTAVGLAPLTRDRARRMLESLRQSPLLKGWRGAEPIDLDAAAAALVVIARAAAEHPEYSELEVNPVLAHPGGVTALDAYGVLAPAPPVADLNHEADPPGR